MKVIFDTNVIIDVLERREPFFLDSYAVLQLSATKKVDGFICAGCITDIHYILRKNITDKNKVEDAITGLAKLVGVCDTLASDITLSHTFKMNDFEDAVIAATAKRENANYIVTRNKQDFKNSPVPAIYPTELLSLVTHEDDK